jgi:hypothetical protein
MHHRMTERLKSACRSVANGCRETLEGITGCANRTLDRGAKCSTGANRSVTKSFDETYEGVTERSERSNARIAKDLNRPQQGITNR